MYGKHLEQCLTMASMQEISVRVKIHAKTVLGVTEDYREMNVIQFFFKEFMRYCMW